MSPLAGFNAGRFFESLGLLVWSTKGRCSGCTDRVYPSAAGWPHAADCGSASESRTPERDQKAPRIIIAHSDT